MSDGPKLGRVGVLLSGARFGRFASVGLLGYTVDNLVLAGLIELVGASVIVAKPVSAEAAIIVMFIANERWTFRRWGAPGTGAVGRRFLRSNMVRWTGAGVAYVVLVVLVTLLGLHYFIANTLGIGMGFAVNYVAEHLFTWKVGRQA